MFFACNYKEHLLLPDKGVRDERFFWNMLCHSINSSADDWKFLVYLPMVLPSFWLVKPPGCGLSICMSSGLRFKVQFVHSSMNLKPFQQWGQGGYVCLQSCLPIQLKSWQAHCHPTATEKKNNPDPAQISTSVDVVVFAFSTTCWHLRLKVIHSAALADCQGSQPATLSLRYRLNPESVTWMSQSWLRESG